MTNLFLALRSLQVRCRRMRQKNGGFLVRFLKVFDFYDLPTLQEPKIEFCRHILAGTIQYRLLSIDRVQSNYAALCSNPSSHRRILLISRYTISVSLVNVQSSCISQLSKFRPSQIEPTRTSSGHQIMRIAFRTTLLMSR